MEFLMNSLKIGRNGWSGHHTYFMRKCGKRRQSLSNGPKVGSKSKQLLQNYRPSLSSIFGKYNREKIFCCIVNERIKRATDNIYVIREIIDKHNREKTPLYLAFLDIEKAYDRVNRETLIYILDKLGFSTNICYLIKSMY